MAKKRTELSAFVRVVKKSHEGTVKTADELHTILTNLRYEGKHLLGRNLREIREILEYVDEELDCLIDTEEQVLFPFLRTHMPKLGSVLHLFGSEHEDFRKNLKIIQAQLDKLSREENGSNRAKIIERISETGTYLIYLIRNHIQAESKSIYKIIEHDLHASEKRELTGQLRQHNGKILR